MTVRNFLEFFSNKQLMSRFDWNRIVMRVYSHPNSDANKDKKLFLNSIRNGLKLHKLWTKSLNIVKDRTVYIRICSTKLKCNIAFKNIRCLILSHMNRRFYSKQVTTLGFGNFTASNHAYRDIIVVPFFIFGWFLTKVVASTQKKRNYIHSSYKWFW